LSTSKTLILYIDTTYKIKKNSQIKKRYTFSRYEYAKKELGYKLFKKYHNLRILNIPIIINDKLLLKNGEFIEKNNSKLCDNFGQSIHYCNLRINKIPINQIMKKIHPNIYGIGMSFIDPDVPGPISNDIILDSYKKTINI